MRDYREDFESWAHDCVRIADKESGLQVPFVANAAQKRLLDVMESQRRAGEPIRIIVLKARQWGCSTLVEIYMAWMQLVRHRGWNSLICAHVKDASAGIKGMYSRLLRDYPERMKTGEAREWTFTPFEKSQSVSHIAARDCTVTVATALSPNSARGTNISMAHLSEVAFWGDGDEKVASEIVRTVSGSVSRSADTVVVMESTANGPDNWFHSEWERACRGQSDKTPIFVPWHEIEIYRLSDGDSRLSRISGELDDYERGLLAGGIGIAQVAWYHEKRREYSTHEAMMAEFPSTPEEAFAYVGGERALDPARVPEVSDLPKGDYDSKLCVALSAGRSVSVFGMKEGEVHPLGDQRLESTAGEFAAKVIEMCRKEGMALVVAGTSGTDAHATYLAEKASEAGIGIAADDDEEGFIGMDRGMVSLCAEIYSEGRVKEHSREGRDSLLRLTATSPWREPEALARVVAAYIADRSTGIPLKAEDFLW